MDDGTTMRLVRRLLQILSQEVKKSLRPYGSKSNNNKRSDLRIYCFGNRAKWIAREE